MITDKATDDLDLCLAVLCAITPEGHEWTLRDIAELTGQKKGRIERIESNAKRKFMAAAGKLNLDDYIKG